MSRIDQIIGAVEASNLVTADVVAELRRKLERSGNRIDLRSAVKWLTEKEHITRSQGKRLLASADATARTLPPPPEDGVEEDDLALPMEEPQPPPAKPALGKAPPPKRAPPTETRAWPARRAEPEEELVLADEEPAPPSAKPARTTPAAAGDEDLELLDDESPPAGAPPRHGTPRERTAPAAGAGKRWSGTPAPSPARQPEPPRAAPPPAASPTGRAADDLFGEPELLEMVGAVAPHGFDAQTPGSASRNRPVRTSQREKNVWDSPLLLWVGGSVTLLLIVGGGLWWALSRGSADKAFKSAEQFYTSGSYTQAIAGFEKYLEDYPGHKDVSRAKVHLAMARLRQTVEGTRDWPKALDSAKQTIDAIRAEQAVGDARPELASLLPRIAEGLAKQADEKGDKHLVELARECLAMVDKYVPKELKPTQQLADVNSSLGLTEHKLGRDAALAETLEAIRQAVADGKAQDAYPQRKQLLEKYPDLASNEALQDEINKVSQAERDAVQYVAQPRVAEPADAPSPVQAEVIMAPTSGREAPGVAGEIVFVLADGTAYALEATSGRALWRRFVGFDTNFVPAPITPDVGSDALLVDAARHELVRVEAKTGKARWRFVVGEPFDAQPVVLHGRGFVATLSGRLIEIDLDTGNSPGYVQLPQPLRVGPAFDPREQVIYQIAADSNLYVLSPATHQCQEVLYLGHEPESIRVPPQAVSRYVLVAENSGASDGVLRVLETDEQGLGVRQKHQEPLAGHILAPIQVSGRLLVAATDRGSISVFEINPPEQPVALSKTAERPPENRPPLVRYPLLQESELWIAGLGLTKYDIQAARGRLEPKWVKDELDTLFEAPRVINDVLFHVRRKEKAEVLVSGVNAGTGVRIWETSLATPAAGEPVLDAAADKATLVNTAGALFEVTVDELAGPSVQSQARASTTPAAPLVEGCGPSPLAGGRLVLATAPGQSEAVVVGEAPARTPQRLALPDPLGSSPIGLAGGVLAPGRLGQVFLLDPQTGRSLAAPFQPRLEPGEQFAWSRPTALGANDVLLADGRGKLYHLAVEQQSPARLAPVAAADLPGPVTAPIAALEQTVYAVSGDGTLRSFALAGLKVGGTWPIESAAWGPGRVGGLVLASTFGGELMALDDEQQLVWRVPLAHGPLAGSPWAEGESLVLSTTSGTVYRLAAASGEEQAQVDLGQPLGSGPVALGQKLLVASYDGAILVLSRP